VGKRAYDDMRGRAALRRLAEHRAVHTRERQGDALVRRIDPAGRCASPGEQNIPTLPGPVEGITDTRPSGLEIGSRMQTSTGPGRLITWCQAQLAVQSGRQIR